MIEKKGAYFLAFILVIISVSLVSASISDFFKVTGQATSQKTNVTVSFRDKYPAVITYVSPVVNVNPVEASEASVNFSVWVYSKDKLRDINFTSVFATITNGSATYTIPCTNTNNLSSYTANFSCEVPIWYWDTAGGWNINVTASDLGNGTPAYNDTTAFTYNQLKAMLIAPNLLTWPYLEVAATNQPSNNDPTIINNTGNYNGTVEVTAYELLGEADATEMLTAENFTAGITTGGAECVAPATADALVNDTAVTITNSVPNPGNLSKSDGSGQENVYYCIPIVPNVSAQTYSTYNSTDWVVAYGI